MGRAPTRQELLSRLGELEARAAEREQLLLDLEVHREEVRMQNERLQETQRVLEESRDRYADLYDFAPLGYLTFDPFGIVLELNLTAATMLGTPRGELVGMPFLHRLPEAFRKPFLDHMLRCRSAGEATSELELQRPDRMRVPVELFTRCVEHDDRQELLSAMTDLSERQRSRSERERLLFERERERAASEAKGRFLAILSHELRTPLTPILATVSALQREAKVPAELRSAVAMIRRNVELEARLIDDLLDLTRIEHGKLSLERRPVDVHEVLERVVANARALPAAAGLDVEMALGASRHHAMGDSARLQQVFANLLGNAVKFTPAGGWIRVSTADAAEGELEVTVADSGIGIAPDQAAHLFQPFEHYGGDRGGRSGGLGLGLAIARGLVAAHHGRIAVSSSGTGSGSIFTVRLPARKATRATPTPVELPLPRAALRNGEPLPVLLVEDHADSADALAELLGLAGCEVTVARSVADALTALRPEHRLLISDLALPDGTGRDLLERLRAQGREVDAIVLSGFGTDEDVKKSLQAGFREHLVKPVDADQLLAAVRRLAPHGN
jgi:PAS domain S-box-containing protein